jgi:hypothetical protein
MLGSHKNPAVLPSKAQDVGWQDGQRFLCDPGIKGNLFFGTITFYDIQLLRKLQEFKPAPGEQSTLGDVLNKAEEIIQMCANSCAKTLINKFTLFKV